MRWHAQVAHMMRKDLRASRAHLVAYAVAVAGATAVAVAGAGHTEEGPSVLWLLVVMFLGVAVAALLVQADSPGRSNAFWATLPLDSSAVFAAKIAGAGLFLLALPLAGQLAALLAHGVAARDLPALLGTSALIYAAWLAAGAVIAALTPDYRAFAVAFMMILVGGLLGTWAVASLAGPAALSLVVSAAAVATGALFLLLHQYRTRDVRRGVGIAVGVAAAALLLPLATRGSLPAAAAASDPLPEALRTVTLEVYYGPTPFGNDAGLGLRLLGASASHHYRLVSPRVLLHQKDGSSMRVEGPRLWAPAVSLNEPRVRLRGVAAWPTDSPAPAEHVTGVPVDLSREQRAALARGDAWFAVEGRLEVRVPRIWADLPLETGSASAEGRRRVRVLRVDNPGGDPLVELRLASVGRARPDDDDDFPFSGPRYALLNPERRELVRLQPKNTSGSQSVLVLPGAAARGIRWELRHAPWRPDVRIEDEWLRGARLLLVDWVPVGSTPVRASGVSGGRAAGTAAEEPRRAQVASSPCTPP